MFTFSKSPAGIPVITTDHKMSILVGGAGAIKWLDACESMKGIKKDCPYEIEDEQQVIVLNVKAVEMMTELETLAVILHEEGHIVLDHLNHPEAISLMEQGKIPSTEWMELEADTYSANRVGKKTMSSALIKLTNQFMVSKTYLKAVGITGKVPDDIIKLMTDQINKAIGYRFLSK